MLYRFDEVSTALELVPLAARRALDQAGLKLSLPAWTTLELSDRRRLVEIGAATTVDVAAVRETVQGAQPEPKAIAPVDDPSANSVPKDVTAALETYGGMPIGVWGALSPLDRYTLAKVVSRGRERRISAAYAEIVGFSRNSSHIAPSGGVRMVDVGAKATTERVARASSRIQMNDEAFKRLSENSVPKGDVLGTARLAGIMAAKRTHELIPLCHQLKITNVVVELALDESANAVDVVATVKAHDRTGVEMESLTAASVAALTLYDMLKAFDKSMVIGPTRLLAKSGGRSGDFRATSEGEA